MLVRFIVFLAITLVLFCMCTALAEHFVPDHKSKCFSCEKQAIAMYGPDGAWTANPTKGFDDEKEGILQAGGDISGGFIAKSIKYY